jgi:hypothetical protein
MIVDGTRTATASVALASSCVKKPWLDAAAMEPDVIMSCITPSFGDDISLEKESGPRRRASDGAGIDIDH